MTNRWLFWLKTFICQFWTLIYHMGQSVTYQLSNNTLGVLSHYWPHPNPTHQLSLRITFLLESEQPTKLTAYINPTCSLSVNLKVLLRVRMKELSTQELRCCCVVLNPFQTSEWAGVKSCGTELMQLLDKSVRTPMNLPVFSPGRDQNSPAWF